VLVYTLLLVPVAVGAALTSLGGPLTLAVTVALNLWFVLGAYRIWRRDEAVAEADKYAVEKAFFRFSLLYLFLHFAAYLVEAALRSFGAGGW
jgi:protoheme IX farnesyltransferase